MTSEEKEFRSELLIHIRHLHANRYAVGHNDRRAQHHKRLHEEGKVTFEHEHTDFHSLEDLRSLNGR